MSAGSLAAKLIVKPRDIVRALKVRPETPEGPDGPEVGAPGGGVDFGGDFGASLASPPEGPEQPVEEVGPGWESGEPAEYLDVFCHEESAREKLAAGKPAAETTYRLYGELVGASPAAPLAEDDYLSVPGEGIVNVTGVVKRPTEGLYVADARRVEGE